MPPTAPHRSLEVVRSKFKDRQTRQLLQMARMANWSDSPRNICRQLQQLSEEELGDKYVWMVGSNPAYFIQYQVDSYAIMRGHNKAVLVWKPKYIEYPSVVKLEDFGDNPKLIKSMELICEETHGVMAEEMEPRVCQHLRQFYGAHFFATEEQEFQTKLVTELKHFATRVSKASYWHCVMDSHNGVDVSSRGNLYIRVRVRGVREKYDKDILLFSKQGQRQFMLRDKKTQILSFFAMLIIFVTVIQCPEDSSEGVCVYRNELMMLGAAIMMGLMGMRVAARNKAKKKMDDQVKQALKD